jgi:hypothetical protein
VVRIEVVRIEGFMNGIWSNFSVRVLWWIKP